jgi:hypothetical protein
MITPRKVAITLALGTLTALAPMTAGPADARHEDFGNSEITCYVKTGDWFRCFHAGPMSGLTW